jgi:hypothetical protein
MNGGFSLTINPLLSLGADQEEKIRVKAQQTAAHAVSPQSTVIDVKIEGDSGIQNMVVDVTMGFFGG